MAGALLIPSAIGNLGEQEALRGLAVEDFLGGVLMASSDDSDTNPQVVAPALADFAGTPQPEDPCGDLTTSEIEAIQEVVDQAGRPLEVVGSAAQGARRGVGTDLPIGKGPGTRSDIDYLIPPSSLNYYNGLESRLPSIDPKSGAIIGSHNRFMGPAIRFEPGAKPQCIPMEK
jgi:hypothetical protein